KVTERSFNVATVRRNTQDALDKRVPIASLQKSFGQNRVQATTEIHSHMIFALISSNGGVCEVCITMARKNHGKKGSQNYGALEEMVSKVDCEVLKSRVVGSVINPGVVWIWAVIFRDDIGQFESRG